MWHLDTFTNRWEQCPLNMRRNKVQNRKTFHTMNVCTIWSLTIHQTVERFQSAAKWWTDWPADTASAQSRAASVAKAADLVGSAREVSFSEIKVQGAERSYVGLWGMWHIWSTLGFRVGSGKIHRHTQGHDVGERNPPTHKEIAIKTCSRLLSHVLIYLPFHLYSVKPTEKMHMFKKGYV